MENKTLLEVEKLEVVYHHASTAIQGVSFKITEGQIFAIIGANGAGKTTTLRAISGFLGSDNAKVTDGEVKFMGERLNNLLPHQIATRGIALVPERNKIFETLTVGEGLAISGHKVKGRKEAEDRIYDYFPLLRERRHSLAGYLSGGERQMLAVGQAFLCSPKLLLVDELSLGLAPAVVSGLIQTLAQMRIDLGLTILLVEQNVAAALSIADYAAVMENGRIVFDGTPERLLAHDDVREFYLGIHEGEEKSYQDVKQYRRTRRWWG